MTPVALEKELAEGRPRRPGRPGRPGRPERPMALSSRMSLTKPSLPRRGESVVMREEGEGVEGKQLSGWLLVGEGEAWWLLGETHAVIFTRVTTHVAWASPQRR